MHTSPSRLLFVGALLFGASALSSCSTHSIPFSLASSGHACSSGDVEILSGGVQIRSEHPAVFFGSIDRGAESGREYSFVVLGNTSSLAANLNAANEIGRATCNGGEMTAWSHVTVNGVALEASHVVALDESESAITSETLTLQGQVVDPERGRLFLLDLGHPERALVQVDAPLPAAPGPDDDFESLTGALVERLLDEHEQVRELLRR